MGKKVGKQTTAKIELTAEELNVLESCLGNGYGDGDFDEWLNDKVASEHLQTGWQKLNKAIQELERK